MQFNKQMFALRRPRLARPPACNTVRCPLGARPPLHRTTHYSTVISSNSTTVTIIAKKYGRLDVPVKNYTFLDNVDEKTRLGFCISKSAFD